MKTKRFLIISIVFIFLIICVSCSKKDNIYDKLFPNISNCQTSLYVASDDNLLIELSSFNKEEVFVADGKVEDVVQIDTLLVKPKNSDYLNYEYSYSIIGELGSIDGDLNKTALGISFRSDIENINEIGKINSVVIKHNDKQTSYELKNIPHDNVSYKNIATIAYEHFKEKLDPNNFDREIYIKLIQQENNEDSPYYWYISFLKNTNDYLSLVIDLNGKIISEKIANEDSSNWVGAI